MFRAVARTRTQRVTRASEGDVEGLVRDASRDGGAKALAGFERGVGRDAPERAEESSDEDTDTEKEDDEENSSDDESSEQRSDADAGDADDGGMFWQDGRPSSVTYHLRAVVQRAARTYEGLHWTQDRVWCHFLRHLARTTLPFAFGYSLCGLDFWTALRYPSNADYAVLGANSKATGVSSIQRERPR